MSLYPSWTRGQAWFGTLLLFGHNYMYLIKYHSKLLDCYSENGFLLDNQILLCIMTNARFNPINKPSHNLSVFSAVYSWQWGPFLFMCCTHVGLAWVGHGLVAKKLLWVNPQTRTQTVGPTHTVQRRTNPFGKHRTHAHYPHRHVYWEE